VQLQRARVRRVRHFLQARSHNVHVLMREHM
jgi:hypothetical protein